MTITDQLRAARDDMRGGREVRRMPTQGFEMREVPNGTGGVALRCAGYASVTCADTNDKSNAYEMEDAYGPWIESIMRGAFRKTLADEADVAFLVNHTGVTMARTKPGTLTLAEDSTGLHYEALLNPGRPDVQILRAAVEEGAIDESSFAFRVVRQEWNEDYTRRWIKEINLDKGDVSPVNYGANPHTGGLVSIRNRHGRSGRSSRNSEQAPVVLPDHTTRARMQLARLGVPISNSRSSSLPDATKAARRKLEEARRSGGDLISAREKYKRLTTPRERLDRARKVSP
jgi:HK97 family phage prohead protease